MFAPQRTKCRYTYISNATQQTLIHTSYLQKKSWKHTGDTHPRRHGLRHCLVPTLPETPRVSLDRCLVGASPRLALPRNNTCCCTQHVSLHSTAHHTCTSSVSRSLASCRVHPWRETSKGSPLMMNSAATAAAALASLSPAAGVALFTSCFDNQKHMVISDTAAAGESEKHENMKSEK